MTNVVNNFNARNKKSEEVDPLILAMEDAFFNGVFHGKGFRLEANVDDAGTKYKADELLPLTELAVRGLNIMTALLARTGYRVSPVQCATYFEPGFDFHDKKESKYPIPMIVSEFSSEVGMIAPHRLGITLRGHIFDNGNPDTTHTAYRLHGSPENITMPKVIGLGPDIDKGAPGVKFVNTVLDNFDTLAQNWHGGVERVEVAENGDRRFGLTINTGGHLIIEVMLVIGTNYIMEGDSDGEA